MAFSNSTNPALKRSFKASFTATTDRLSIEDVVMHTLGLLAIVGVSGAVGWQLAPNNTGVIGISAIGAFVLSLIIAFGRIKSAPLIILFAILEGLALGAISNYYDSSYNGIALQAAIGTGLDFGVMLFLYQSRTIRATPKMRKVVYSTLISVVALSLLDVGLQAFGGHSIGLLHSSSPLAILFTVAVLVIASLQFILDFDYIESAISQGASKDEAWVAAYGLLIGLVWVYTYLLRLLSQLNRA